MNEETYYRFQQGPEKATIWMAGTIGNGRLTSTQLRADFAKCDDLSKVNVRLHSFGGCFRQARKIHSVLRGAASLGAKIVINIEAVAASGGAMIALAGDEIRIPANAFMMVHLPYMDEGQTETDNKRRDLLIVDAAMRTVALVCRRTGLDEKVVSEMLAEEVWFDAAEAKHAGLADSIISPTQLATSLCNKIPHTPGALSMRFGIWQGAQNQNRKRIRMDDGTAHMRRTALNIHRKNWRVS